SSLWTLVCALPSGEPLFAWDGPSQGVQFVERLLLVVPERGEGQIIALPTPDEILQMAEARVHDKPTADERAAFGLNPER
ncbi:MAG: hypothetical protein ABI652_07205, partial [Acidobacteriota bacterium]